LSRNDISRPLNMIPGHHMRKAPTRLRTMAPDHYEGWILAGNEHNLTIFRSVSSLEWCNKYQGGGWQALREALPEEVDRFFDDLHVISKTEMDIYDQLPKKVQELVADIPMEAPQLQSILDCYRWLGEAECIRRLRAARKDMENAH
jgi:hypothetical protein